MATRRRCLGVQVAAPGHQRQTRPRRAGGGGKLERVSVPSGRSFGQRRTRRPSFPAHLNLRLLLRRSDVDVLLRHRLLRQPGRSRLRAVADESDALPLVLELRQVAPATVLARVDGGQLGLDVGLEAKRESREMVPGRPGVHRHESIAAGVGVVAVPRHKDVAAIGSRVGGIGEHDRVLRARDNEWRCAEDCRCPSKNPGRTADAGMVVLASTVPDGWWFASAVSISTRFSAGQPDWPGISPDRPCRVGAVSAP